MQSLGILGKHLEAFCDAIWEQFCTKLIYSEEDANEFMKIDTDKFAENTWLFEVKKDVQTTKKPEPSKVFRQVFKTTNSGLIYSNFAVDSSNSSRDLSKLCVAFAWKMVFWWIWLDKIWPSNWFIHWKRGASIRPFPLRRPKEVQSIRNWHSWRKTFFKQWRFNLFLNNF